MSNSSTINSKKRVYVRKNPVKASVPASTHKDSINKSLYDLNSQNKKNEKNNDQNNKLINDLIEDVIDKFEEDDYIFQQEKGHAILFNTYNKDNIYLSSINGHGYYFNQIYNIWQKKENNFFIAIVSDFLETHIQDYITKIKDDKTKTNKFGEVVKILTRVRTFKHAENVWKMAKCRLVDKNFQIKMNKAPNLLPLKNGKIIDLKTLEVKLRKKTEYFDFELPFEFIKDSKLTYATKFFNEIMNNDNEIVNYLQIILGYCLSGETTMRSLFIFWGNGANGKSTLCDLLTNIMDKFYMSADKKIFIKQESSSSHTSYLMPLLNARLAVLSETSEGEKLNERLLKALTGNDSISGRELYGTQISFKPYAKYIMLTNYKPIFDVNSKAMTDRICYIPFKASFSYNPKNGEFLRDDIFVEKLKTEYLNEVFIWLCIGANNNYKANGNIKIPKLLMDAKNDYINEIDNVAKFIEDKCTKKENTKTKRNELYDHYQSYCTDNGYTSVKNCDFYKRLDILEFKQVIIKGIRYIKDIEIVVVQL